MSARRRKVAAGEPAQLVHAIPGRARLRIPGRRGDAAWFEHAAKELQRAPDVEAVVATARTASLLVLHRGEIAALVRWAAKHGLFEATAEATRATGAAAAGARAADWLRQLGPRRPDGSFDPERARAIVFAALGAYQAARGRVLPPGFTMLDEALRSWLRATSGPGDASADDGGDVPGGGSGTPDGDGA